MHMRSSRFLLIALALSHVALGLVACGDSGPARCPTLLPATHLYESNCPGGDGYCFVDHEVPF